MKQSKRMSLMEAGINVLSGMFIAFCISQSIAILSPYIAKYLITGFHFDLNLKSNILVTVILTFASIIRNYCWRRYFNNKIHARIKKDY